MNYLKELKQNTQFPNKYNEKWRQGNESQSNQNQSNKEEKKEKQNQAKVSKTENTKLTEMNKHILVIINNRKQTMLSR